MGDCNNWKEAEIPRDKLECNRLHTKILWGAYKRQLGLDIPCRDIDLIGMDWVSGIIFIKKQTKERANNKNNKTLQVILM